LFLGRAGNEKPAWPDWIPKLTEADALIDLKCGALVGYRKPLLLFPASHLQKGGDTWNKGAEFRYALIRPVFDEITSLRSVA
jgi:hypothetical protein